MWLRATFLTCGLAILGNWAGVAHAQLSRGGEIRLESLVSGEERARQPDHWTAEIHLKPLRLIQAEITDPKTGEKKPEYIWYLAYRIYNRPFARLDETNRPENTLDAPQIPPMFVPEFTLVAKSSTAETIYQDVIAPEAVAAINRRERSAYKSTIDIIGPLPIVAKGDEPNQKSLDGVAVFRNIDLNADRYTIFMTGFSNGFQVLPGGKPNAKPTVQLKTVKLEFWRPGDRFDINEPEIRMEGKPVWVYR